MEGSLIKNFLGWWYGERFAQFLQYLKRLFVYIYDLFSVEICLRTLFGVWRRDAVTYDDLSIQEVIQAWGLNLASRIIGFFVKTSTLIAYLITASASVVIFIFFIIVWLCYPLLLIALPVIGFSLKF